MLIVFSLFSSLPPLPPSLPPSLLLRRVRHPTRRLPGLARQWTRAKQRGRRRGRRRRRRTTSAAAATATAATTAAADVGRCGGREEIREMG